MRKSIIRTGSGILSFIDVSDVATSAVYLDYTISFPPATAVISVHTSPNGRFIAIATQGSVSGSLRLHIFDSQISNFLGIDFGFTSGYDVHFSPDSQYLAVAHSLINNATFRIYRTSDWRIIGETPIVPNAKACRFNEDGSRLAIGVIDSAILLVYDFQSWVDGITGYIPLVPNTPIITFNSLVHIEWCPNKDLLAISFGGISTNRRIQIYNTVDWTLVTTLATGGTQQTTATPYMAFSPNGEFFACTTAFTAFSIYETTTWSEVASGSAPNMYFRFTQDSAYFFINKSGTNVNSIQVLRTSDWTNAEGSLVSPPGHLFQGPDLSEISGTVSDFNAALYENTKVRLFHRGNGNLLIEKQSNAQGEFSFIYPFNGEFYTISLCPENELGHLVFNDSIIRGIT